MNSLSTYTIEMCNSTRYSEFIYSSLDSVMFITSDFKLNDGDLAVCHSIVPNSCYHL